MSKQSDTRKGVVGSIREVVDGVLEAVRFRAELFGIELRLERARLVVSTLVVLAVALTAFMTFLCANLLILFLFWEQRLTVCALLFGFYAIATLILGLVVRYRIRNAPVPFEATLAELEKDRALFTKPS